jgi:hypothetical protein
LGGIVTGAGFAFGTAGFCGIGSCSMLKSVTLFDVRGYWLRSPLFDMMKRHE